MPPPATRPPTRRQLLLVGAATWIAGWAAFGLPWNGISRRRRPINLVPFRRGWYRRRDLALNFAYYVPLGWMGELATWPWRTTVLVAAAFSALTEAAQVFSETRYPTLTDFVFNTAGALAGVALVKMVRAFRATHDTRESTERN